MYGPDVVILLIYGSHDVRHADFRRLTVVNGPPGFGASQMLNRGGLMRWQGRCSVPIFESHVTTEMSTSDQEFDFFF